jgi:NADPH2:quinone reductase
MRALIIPAEGEPPEIRNIPDPKPKEGELLVKVLAAGLNYADTMVRRGVYPQKPEFPHVSGFEFCGQVTALGPGVTNWKIGDRAMGICQGAFAEFARVAVQAALPIPSGFSDEEGAAFPVTYLTAFGMLTISAHAKEGETILIHAAAGGVGTASIQLAKQMGLRVIATASSDEKLEVAKRQGADVTINYKAMDFVEPVLQATGGKGVDIVFESIGGDSVEKDLKVCGPFGRIIVFGAASGKPSTPDVAYLYKNSVALAAFWLATLMQNPSRMAPLAKNLLELVEKSGIRPVIGKVYSLEQGNEAFSALESRASIGKLVLKP